MVDRQGELDTLQREVARGLEPLGKVTLATPFKSCRRVTVEHPSGAEVRVILSAEFRGRAYQVSVLRVADDFNSKLTRAHNHTIRNLQPGSPELESLFSQVRETLDALAQLKAK